MGASSEYFDLLPLLTSRSEQLTTAEYCIASRLVERCLKTTDPEEFLGRQGWIPPASLSILITEMLRSSASDPALGKVLARNIGLLVKYLSTPSYPPAAREQIATPHQLARWIMNEIPSLWGLLWDGKTLKSALLLRDWLGENTAITNDPELQYSSEDVVASLRAFWNGEGGVWCYGSALVYRQLLELFSIPASTWSYAYDRPAHPVSHTTTIVYATEKDDFFLLDAYFVYHYTDSSTGEILPFDELLGRVYRAEFSSIEVVTTPKARTCVLGEPANSFELSPEEQASMTTLPSGRPGFTMRVTAEKLVGFKDAMRQAAGGTPLHEFELELLRRHVQRVRFVEPVIEGMFVERLSARGQIEVNNCYPAPRSSFST